MSSRDKHNVSTDPGSFVQRSVTVIQSDDQPPEALGVLTLLRQRVDSTPQRQSHRDIAAMLNWHLWRQLYRFFRTPTAIASSTIYSERPGGTVMSVHNSNSACAPAEP